MSTLATRVEVGGLPAESSSNLIKQKRGREFFHLLSHFPDIDTLKRRISLPGEWLSDLKAGQVPQGLAILITAGAILASLPFFEQKSAQAEGLFFPTPTPTPEHTHTPTAETQQIIQTIENPIYFIDSLGRQREQTIDNARHGIPPNGSDEQTGTVDEEINGVYEYSFQTKNSLYPEVANGARTVIGGLVVDVAVGKEYMATGVVIDNIVYPRIEYISDINDPTDYSDGARVVVKDGIGDIGHKGDYDSFYMGSDSQGKYLDLVLSRSVDPSKNGTYRIRLDSQGNFSGSFFKVQEEGTPTPTPSPILPFKVWLPQVIKN